MSEKNVCSACALSRLIFDLSDGVVAEVEVAKLEGSHTTRIEPGFIDTSGGGTLCFD